MKEISEIEFSLFSPDQIRKMSAVKITIADTYDEDGYPIANGLADQRLGVIDPGLKCRTCGGRMKDCPGHFGHIELVRPVIHAGFGKVVYQLLRATCGRCGRLLSEKSGVTRIVAAKECPHCGELQQKIKFVKPTSYYEEKRKLLPNEVRERLERIQDADLRQLGIGIRPEQLVLTVLIVAPVTVRPSITLETGERSEDDLTHKLVDILRINQRLEENVDAGAPQLIIEDLWELLQYHVTTYFDNETSGIPPARHRSGRQLKTLFQRLKGKEGRFRYNLSGKRVNFSARTVISPDPTLGINELGVPESMAKELSLPVSVTEWNIEKIKEFLRLHPEKVSYIIRPDGRRKKLTESNADEILEELTPGYRVERQLVDGDLVIFNRQPSLHRVSMMCHEIKVLPGKTLRFNICDCKPYNADFDGDEMNIHVPQNEEAQSEAETLMKVQSQILSPRNGAPIITLELDQITGIHLLTNKEVELSKEDACELLNAAGVVAEAKNNMSGREVFSKLLPEGFNMETKNRSCKKCGTCKKERCEYNAFVKIRNGRLLSGHIDSKTSEKLVEQLFKNLGAEATRAYLDAASKISTKFATKYGFSLGLDDYFVPEEAVNEIHAVYGEGIKRLNQLIGQLHSQRLEQLPGKTLKETFEEKTMRLLEGIRYRTWKVAEKSIRTRSVFINGKKTGVSIPLMLARAGVRSRATNVVQMCGVVGQQAVRGKRPTSGYQKRLLPHYGRNDFGDEANGFVKHSFKHGLTPTEYFFHAAGGRDSVVDKGVNPAKTGYMQRRLVNALLDLVVRQDHSVRDAENNVVQFEYNNGLDVSNGEAIAYSEPVGVLAAQSIGEPGTQMTLRTFHFAGIASLAQLGFTRLVEIVDARKTPKKPVMEMFLKTKYRSWDSAKRIAAAIEEITLETVANINEDFNKKVVVIELNRAALRERGLSEPQVVKKIESVHPQYKKDGNVITIRSKKDTLRNIRKMTTQLRGLHLKGMKGIRKAILVDKKHPDGSRELTIATDGSNLEEVFEVPEVDAERTTTNDFMEIARVLGIDAARNSLILEIHKVLEAQDLKVDTAHYTLIADAMTSSGDIKSVGRHGLAGGKRSILARAAFEETSKHLLNACLKQDSDKLTGITENIIVGQTTPCGTGNISLVMEPQ